MSVDAIGSSFDEDDLLQRAHAMQGLSGVNYTPISIPTPSGISSVSTISTAPQKQELAYDNRPALPLPKNAMLALLDVHMEMERLVGKNGELFKAQSDANTAELEKLFQEKLDIIRKEAESTQSKDTWTALANISQYIAGIGAIAIGTAYGGWPGAVLIASGVLGVGNAVIHDTNLLKVAVEWYTKSEEQQRNITQFIEMSLLTMQLGLGLAGGYGVAQAGALAAAQGVNALNFTQRAIPVLTTAGQIMGAGARVGVEAHKSKIAHFQARMKEIDAQHTITEQRMSKDMNDMTSMMKAVESQTDELKRIIQNAEVME